MDYLSSHETSLGQSTEVNHKMYDKGFSPCYGKKGKQILIFTERDLFVITLTNNTNIHGTQFIKEVTAYILSFSLLGFIDALEKGKVNIYISYCTTKRLIFPNIFWFCKSGTEMRYLPELNCGGITRRT